TRKARLSCRPQSTVSATPANRRSGVTGLMCGASDPARPAASETFPVGRSRNFSTRAGSGRSQLRFTVMIGAASAISPAPRMWFRPRPNQKRGREGMENEPQVVMIGAGAMGGVIAGALARAGVRLSIIDTDAGHVEAINREGLRVAGLGDGAPLRRS